jgi:peptide/nickel transport system ATP-binding protein
MTAEPVARIANLTIGPVTGGAATVSGLDLTVPYRGVLALVGRSGSGKTTTALSLLGHLRPGLVRRSGTVHVAGHDAFTRSGAAALRRGPVAYLPQDAAATLNPARRLGVQLAEATTTRPVPELLDTVHLPADRTFLRRYPHQISGGQAQRVAFALALAGDPRLLILDEPTAGLDPMLVRGVRDLIAQLVTRTATVLVSHDPELARVVADEVVVLEAGRRIATAPAGPTGPVTDRADRTAAPRGIALAVSGLTARHGRTTALAAIDLSVTAGECLALVGASGSGKSTLARCLVGLHPYQGTTALHGAVLAGRAGRRTAGQQRDLQLVAQDSVGALNPRETVDTALRRPLRHLRGLDERAATAEIARLLDRVHLPSGYTQRRPGQLSGGERQRVNLARALAVSPGVLLCDEVTSALDTHTGDAVLDLLAELRRDLGLTVVLITHDLATVARRADSVAVLDGGRIVEHGPAATVLAAPDHAVTRALVAAEKS